MDNLLLIKENAELKRLSAELGYKNTLFLDKDFILITAKTKKELLKKIQQTQKSKQLLLFKPETEELFRFALEKTTIDLIFGIENIHPKNSLHYLRGGIDQITAKIAAENGKIIAFSFSEALNSKDKGKLLARMKANFKICKKYKIKTFVSNFSILKTELRSAKDISSFCRVIGGTGNELVL